MLFILKKTLCYRTVSTILLHVAITSMFFGCKLVPLYGESSAGDARFLKLVKIDRIDNRAGQKLRTILQQKFGQRFSTDNARWLLTVKLAETKRQLAVTQDSTTTRGEVTVTAVFNLKEIGRGTRQLLKGKSLSMSSFNELGSQYAILIAENDARDRALNFIANDLRNRIMLAIRHPENF